MVLICILNINRGYGELPTSQMKPMIQNVIERFVQYSLSEVNERLAQSNRIPFHTSAQICMLLCFLCLCCLSIVSFCVLIHTPYSSIWNNPGCVKSDITAIDTEIGS